MAEAFNPSTWQTEAGGSQIKVVAWLICDPTKAPGLPGPHGRAGMVPEEQTCP